MTTLQILINNIGKVGLEIYLEDKNLKTFRTLRSSRFSYSGPAIGSPDLNDTQAISYLIKFSQMINTPSNPNNPCRYYPNEEFESFEECDAKFVRERIRKDMNFIPFWATKNLTEVTKIAFSNKRKAEYMKYALGMINSPCLNPCTLTQVV